MAEQPVWTGPGARPTDLLSDTGTRRRRPSGEPPPLPRDPEWTRWLWLAIVVGALGVTLALLLPWVDALDSFDQAILRAFANIRTGWLTSVARFLHGLTGVWFVFALRLATLLVLALYRRWRHLVVFLATFVIIDWLAVTVLYVARPAPDVPVLVQSSAPAFPAPALSSLAITLSSMAFVLAVGGRPRSQARGVANLIGIAVALADVYLAADYPIDVAYAVMLGSTVAFVMFEWLAPEASFPVSYRRGGTAAHLDLTKREGPIREALSRQLGITVTEVKPFGLSGSGGSSPLRLGLEGGAHLFGKIYATSHLRADRWYKVGRTLMYGELEDEVPFASVRKLVEYEDYALRLMDDIGVRVARSQGVIELTPDREYMLVTEFFEGSKQLGESEIDDTIIDEGLVLIRKLWDAGLAHRDVKPANLLVRDGHLQLVDVSNVEVRPTPWRTAVDLANMMLTLALQSDADRVYHRAIRVFRPDEVAEGFACAVGMAIPTQLGTRLAQDGRPLMARFKELAPRRDPVKISRWSARRVALLLVSLGAVVVLADMLVQSLTAGLK